LDRGSNITIRNNYGVKVSISIVVGSMDSREDLWPVFKHGFNKYWSDCPWEKYFITNYMKGPKEFKTLKTGKEVSWSQKINVALNGVYDDIVLYLCDDYWISGPVQTKVMVEFYNLMMKHRNIDTIRLRCPSYDAELCPQKELTKPIDLDKRLWEFKIDAMYRAATYCNFYRKEALLRYMREGMSCWDHETEASALSSNSNKLYLCAIDPYIFPTVHQTNPFLNGNTSEPVVKGMWQKSAYEYVKKEGLKVDFSFHPNGKMNKEPWYITKV
jgi:hypothetical protein